MRFCSLPIHVSRLSICLARLRVSLVDFRNLLSSASIAFLCSWRCGLLPTSSTAFSSASILAAVSAFWRVRPVPVTASLKLCGCALVLDCEEVSLSHSLQHDRVPQLPVPQSLQCHSSSCNFFQPPPRLLHAAEALERQGEYHEERHAIVFEPGTNGADRTNCAKLEVSESHSLSLSLSLSLYIFLLYIYI